jgi:phage terminase large subunit-like protein
MTLLDTPDLSLVLRWAVGTEEEKDKAKRVIASMTPIEREALAEQIEAMRPPPAPWVPLPYQVPPPLDEYPHWFGFLLMGGRNIGKTATITRYMNDHALGPPCLHGPVPHRMGIIAATLGDASASVVNGEDGLKTVNPDVKEITRKGGTTVVWPNGAMAYLFGAWTQADVDRLRPKTNRCLDVREEIATWRYLREAFAQADLSLRSGPRPHWVGATTPRPRPTIRRLNASPIVRVSRAKSSDNIHANPERMAQLYEEYGNTRLGLQELEGEILDEISGALWAQELIEQWRVGPDEVPRLTRVRTYVDPSWGTTHDECGIIVVGRGTNNHAYILEDLSKRMTPDEWAMTATMGRTPRRVKDARGRDIWDMTDMEPKEWFGRRSERVVAEKNFQGVQVQMAMREASRALGRLIPFGWVVASQGKRLRAEPVHMLYERGRVHHVGNFPALEFQLTAWVPPEAGEDAGDPGDPAIDETGNVTEEASKWSPDRLDALVYGVTDLLLSTGAGTGKLHVADGRVPGDGQRSKGADQRPRPKVPMVQNVPRSTRQGQMLERQLGRPKKGPETR